MSLSPPDVAHALKNVLEVVSRDTAPSADMFDFSQMNEDSRLHTCLYILQRSLFVTDDQKVSDPFCFRSGLRRATGGVNSNIPPPELHKQLTLPTPPASDTSSKGCCEFFRP